MLLLLCMTAVVVVKIWRREVAKGYKDLAAASIYPVGSAIRMDSRRMCVASFHRHTGCLHRKATLLLREWRRSGTAHRSHWHLHYERSGCYTRNSAC